jgi:hypothetical protein
MAPTRVKDVSDMSNGQNSADEHANGRKSYSVNVHAKAQSSTSCSFCWFVMTMYPALTGMTERDGATFKAHLQRSHGLKGEIRP